MIADVVEWLTRLAAVGEVVGSMPAFFQKNNSPAFQLSYVNTWILGKVHQVNQLQFFGETIKGCPYVWPCINKIRACLGPHH